MNTAVNVPSVTDCSDGLSVFLAVRPRLFGIAYRVSGNAAEAEDIVQDAWIRWQTADRSGVRDPTAFLTTTTTRLAINVIQSARSRRETGTLSTLPEPVDAGAVTSPGWSKAKRWRQGRWRCWRSFSRRSAPRSFCVRRSITAIARSRTCFDSRKPMRANW